MEFPLLESRKTIRIFFEEKSRTNEVMFRSVRKVKVFLCVVRFSLSKFQLINSTTISTYPMNPVVNGETNLY